MYHLKSLKIIDVLIEKGSVLAPMTLHRRLVLLDAVGILVDQFECLKLAWRPGLGGWCLRTVQCGP